jgi:hypothetical protein
MLPTGLRQMHIEFAANVEPEFAWLSVAEYATMLHQLQRNCVMHYRRPSRYPKANYEARCAASLSAAKLGFISGLHEDAHVDTSVLGVRRASIYLPEPEQLNAFWWNSVVDQKPGDCLGALRAQCKVALHRSGSVGITAQLDNRSIRTRVALH